MLLGRTNVAYPRIWASLGVSSETSPEDLAVAARELKVPLDISSQPALWGGFLRGGTDLLAVKSTTQFERATSQDHATDLIQAHMIEVLSSIGREMIDFYFLRVRRAVEEYQINGALAALEFGKQEGHIRHLGIYADGPSMAVQSVWQFHDAFEVILLQAGAGANSDSLRGSARDKRVGIVETLDRDADLTQSISTDSHAVMASVSTLEDVKTIKGVLGASL